MQQQQPNHKINNLVITKFKKLFASIVGSGDYIKCNINKKQQNKSLSNILKKSTLLIDDHKDDHSGNKKKFIDFFISQIKDKCNSANDLNNKCINMFLCLENTNYDMDLEQALNRRLMTNKRSHILLSEFQQQRIPYRSMNLNQQQQQRIHRKLLLFHIKRWKKLLFILYDLIVNTEDISQQPINNTKSIIIF